MEQYRLDKFLAKAGAGSRSDVKDLIRKGRVAVNENICKDPAQKVSSADRICLDQEMLTFEKYEYYMLNKPAGYVTATKDNLHPTVMDLITSPQKAALSPVGRLDIDTEGLLLITNDGQLAHQLLAPGKHVEKTYYAEIDGCLNEDDVKRFAEGLDIGEKKLTLPAKLNILQTGDRSTAEITVCEGKFHQVKRMVAAAGKKVTYLKRISFGSLVLEESLKKGDFRALTKTEITELKGGKNNHE